MNSDFLSSHLGQQKITMALYFSALPVVVNLRSCSCDIAGRLIWDISLLSFGCWTTAWCLRSVSEAAKVMCGVKFKDLTRNSNNDNSLDLYSAFQEIQGYIRPFFLKSQKPKALVSRWHFKCFLSVLQNSGRNMLQRVGATVLEALSQRTTAWCEGMERRTLTCEHRVWDGV